MVTKRGERHHHPHRHRYGGRGYFQRVGPGLVTGAADDDPSGIGTYSQVGAAFGAGAAGLVFNFGAGDTPRAMSLKPFNAVIFATVFALI